MITAIKSLWEKKSKNEKNARKKTKKKYKSAELMKLLCRNCTLYTDIVYQRDEYKHNALVRWDSAKTV